MGVIVARQMYDLPWFLHKIGYTKRRFKKLQTNEIKTTNRNFFFQERDRNTSHIQKEPTQKNMMRKKEEHERMEGSFLRKGTDAYAHKKENFFYFFACVVVIFFLRFGVWIESSCQMYICLSYSSAAAASCNRPPHSPSFLCTSTYSSKSTSAQKLMKWLLFSSFGKDCTKEKPQQQKIKITNKKKYT